MKRLILSLMFIAATAAAAEAQHSVLAPDGTLFTVDTIASTDPGSTANHFVLRVQRDGETFVETVPATKDASRHTYPAIAHDPVSDSVFVFWLRQLGTMSSQLTFAARNAAGEWSAPTEFGSPFIHREHLRIGVTSRAVDADGGVAAEGAISVHLAWWEFDAHTGVESARYAMLPIENGAVVEVLEADLSEFVDTTVSGPENVDASVLKQALLHTSPSRDNVLITFGDVATRSLHRVRFHPTKIASDVRIRIPIGRAEGGIGAPRFAVGVDARVESIEANGGLILYVSSDDRLQYVALRQGTWSSSRTIALDSSTTREVVLSAIRRLALEQ